jgi:hypothetical protein
MVTLPKFQLVYSSFHVFEPHLSRVTSPCASIAWSIYLKIFINSKEILSGKKFMKFPNGPETPAFLQMRRWIVNPMSFMEDCAKSYGEIFTLRLNKNLPAMVIVN